MWTGAAIGAAGSIAGGLLGGSGAKKASKAQAKATRAATSELRLQDLISRQDSAPWREVGGQAISELGMLLGLTPGGKIVGDPGPRLDKSINYGDGGLEAQSIAEWERQNAEYQDYLSRSGSPQFDDAAYRNANPDLAANRWGGSALEHYNQYGKGEGRQAYWLPQAEQTQDPRFGSLNKKFTLADFWDDPVTKASYQQGLDQGTKALGNMAGARGNRNSGAQLKALTRFSTDYTGNQAAGSYGRFYDDQNRIFNRLSGVAGTGQTSMENQANREQNSANTIAGLTTAQGNARGAAAISGANAMGGALSNAANQYSSQQFLRDILGKGGQIYAPTNYSGYDRYNDPFGGP